MQLAQTARRGLELNNTLVILLTSVILLVSLIGIAYADEVTLETSFPIVYYNCLEGSNGLFPYAECYIQGEDFFIGGDDISYSWDPVEEQYVQTTQLIEEAKILYEEEVKSKEPRKTGLEMRIIYLENKWNPSSSDMAELKLLLQAGALCYTDTLVSQTYRSFDVATEEYLGLDGNWKSQLVEDFAPTTDSFRNSAYEKRLKLAIQECIAQPFTKKSVQYDHMIIDDEYTPIVTHQSKAQGLGYSQEEINQFSNAPRAVTFYNSACPTYNERSKVMFGCATIYDTDVTAHGNIQLKDYGNTSPYQKWLEYKENPYVNLDEYKKNVIKHKPMVYGGGYP